jgi:hypothetical protein
MLTAALAGRLAPAAARWLHVDADHIEVNLHDGPGWGAVESSGSVRSIRVRVTLPTAWLAEIWAAGLTVLSGHLIVSVQQVSWPQAQVLGLRVPGEKPVELTVQHSGQGWAVSR